ncbi:tRNA epoxyqueuosine(34) reductase QueG [Candidatus Peregrinibacteria bacterium]|nr:tRNA epoxyqueuosine(34) reductase QueG [Candidatus Peregrinibacteria bacterium]
MINKIKDCASNLGFDLVKIIKAEKSCAARNRLKKWLKQGFNADMNWMRNRAGIASNPQKILPNAKSVICLATNYFTKIPPHLHKDNARIARYAWCRNYHKIIEKRLKLLAQFIKQIAPNAAVKHYVDTGPFLERHFAAQSDLGIIGKNTCLITQEFGSYVFLAEIITDLELKPDKPIKLIFSCGTCTRCIDSCPTKAIIAPYTIDARKCLSYLTIESRGKIPKNLRAKIPPWLFGCDICQEVCPHNTRAKSTTNPEFHLAPIFEKLTLKNLRAIKTEKQFTKIFSGTSLLRAKFKGIINNVQIINPKNNARKLRRFRNSSKRPRER